MKPTILVISCEHGSNKVPKKYAHLFESKELILQTARAYDLGTSHIANQLHTALHCDFVQARITRLLIDCSRSLHHSRCFSKFSKQLHSDEKNKLITSYYEPFHQNLHETIAAHIAQGQQVLHLSLFTFPPIFHRLFLSTAIGISYDAHRHGEKEVVRILHGLLNKETPSYRIRHNNPLLGPRDRTLSLLREKFEEKEYLGIKLGLNQALITTPHEQDKICKMLVHSLQRLLELL